MIVNSIGHYKTDLECAVIANEWSEVLIEIIPEDMLMKSYKRAFRDKTDTYPISHLNLKLAYENILEDEKAERVEFEKEDRKKNAKKYCKDREQHIFEDGEDSGRIEVLNPRNFSETLTAPCRTCRPKAFNDWREAQSATDDQGTENLGENVLDEMLKKYVPPLTTRMLEVVDKRISSVNSRIFKSTGDELGEIKKERLRLRKIEKYLKARKSRKSDSCHDDGKTKS